MIAAKKQTVIHIKEASFMVRKMKSMDGNNAAAHVSYAFSEVAHSEPVH